MRRQPLPAVPLMTNAAVRLGIPGTDTGVGKTVVGCALIARARQLGLRVGAMKPLETGVDAHPVSTNATTSDAERLRDAAGGVHALSAVRPYALHEPLAPMVAAARADVTISLSVLDEAAHTVSAGREVFVVEGAGGLLVPITPDVSFLDLFARWHCDLLVVAANRLGVLNHVLLTVRAAEASGLVVRAVVLTAADAEESTVAARTNYDALVSLLPHHVIVRFPWMHCVTDLDALAAAAAASGMDAMLYSEPLVPMAPGTLFLD